MISTNQTATHNITQGLNVSAFDFDIVPGHGPEAVLWVVVDALLLVAIVTGNSLSVAIILRTGRRRQRNRVFRTAEATQTTNSTQSTRRQLNHSNYHEMGMHNPEHERNGPDNTYYQKPGARSSARFVLSLAISDLLVGVAMPFHMAFYIQGADGGGSPLRLGHDSFTLGQIEWTCLLRFVFIALACSASACNLLAIAIDRYLAIVYPLHYCRYMTKRVAIIMILSCWGCALVFATVPAYWNRWLTASLCELQDILTPQYITCVVAPLFSAVVIALSIVYWRIGKEARAQLSRLLGADGKGPPWRRRQSGKTYSTSISSEGDHNTTMNESNSEQVVDDDQTNNIENENTNETPKQLKDRKGKNVKNITSRIPSAAEGESTSSNNQSGNDSEGLKQVFKLPNLMETEEEYENVANEKSREDKTLPVYKKGADIQKIIDERSAQGNTTSSNKETNQLQEESFVESLKVTREIFKCQSDPNLMTLMQEGRMNNIKAERENKGHEIITYKGRKEYNTKAKSYNNISLLNDFTTEQKNMFCKCQKMPFAEFQNTMRQYCLSKTTESLSLQTSIIENGNQNPQSNQLVTSIIDSKEINQIAQQHVKKRRMNEMKNEELTTTPEVLNNLQTNSNTLRKNIKKLNKQNELIISVNSLKYGAHLPFDDEKKLNDSEQSMCTPEGKTESSTKKSPNLEKEFNLKYETAATNEILNQNVNKERKQDMTNTKKLNIQDNLNSQCHVNNWKCCIRQCETCQQLNVHEESGDYPDRPVNKEVDGMQQCISRMRSISSNSSGNGGHRNSSWNIRFPSLTSGSTTIRPQLSKSTIVVLLVLGSYVLLWMPFIIISTLLVNGVKLPYTIYRLTFSLAMSNSGVNPIIYGWKNAELKRVFLRFLLNKWHKCTSKWEKIVQEQDTDPEIMNDCTDETEASCIS